ncbi:hypothetical protein Tco_0986609 [Tanacetum coccineum]
MKSSNLSYEIEEGRYAMKIFEQNWSISVKTMMKNSRWNQGLNEPGKLLHLFARDHPGPSEAGAEENGRRKMSLPPLLAAHLGRNKNGQPLQSSLTSVYGGRQSSINIGGNLPLNIMLLSHHTQPFIPSSAHVPNAFIPTYANPYSQPSMGIINGQTQASLSKLRLVIPLLGEPLSTLHKEGLFADPTGFVTPCVCWIEDYPLLDGLKMPSYVPWTNEHPFEKRELNAIIGAWFTLWRD